MNGPDDQTTEREENFQDALERIAEWVEAYPLDIFPEPSKEYLARAAQVLETNGMTIDRISAAAMRHVITRVGKIARAALSGTEP